MPEDPTENKALSTKGVTISVPLVSVTRDEARGGRPMVEFVPAKIIRKIIDLITGRAGR